MNQTTTGVGHHQVALPAIEREKLVQPLGGNDAVGCRLLNVCPRVIVANDEGTADVVVDPHRDFDPGTRNRMEGVMKTELETE